MAMFKFIIFSLLIYSNTSHAQMTDASFFSNVRSINPGVIHLSNMSFIAVDYGKETDKKNHEVPLGGIVGGINTEVNLKKINGFGAIRGHLINTEILFDKTSGDYQQTINSTTRGKRVISDSATSDYLGANVDLYFLGIGYATSNYKYLNEFRVDTVPNLVARDEDKKLKYKNLKIGSAFSLSVLRFGLYYFDQSANGNYSYTFYDGTTGNKGSTETSAVTIKSKGLGAGIGFTLPRLRSELSYEKMYGNSQTINASYPGTVTAPSRSTRISIIGEAKVYSFGVGLRYRLIKGNYIDLNDIITSNLLYEKLGSSDSRNEISFNVSFGSSKGLSPSLFYSTSKVVTKELSPVFDNGLTYTATTNTTAYGLSLSYNF